jgi:hypothetical protein
MWLATSSLSERFHHNLTPNVLLTLLQELGDRLHDLGEVQNEPSIIARQTKKTSHLVNRLWQLSIQDITYHAKVHHDSFR